MPGLKNSKRASASSSALGTDQSTSTAGPTGGPQGNSVLAGVAQRGCTHVVEGGDTLWDLAERYLGSGSRFDELHRENEGLLGQDPNLVQPGQTLDVCPAQSDPQGLSRYGADVTQMSEVDAAAAQADRLAAQAELRGRFEIVGEDFIGPRLPNQVTQEEFERTAAMYSDIRMGHSNIRFDNAGSTLGADDFRDAVMGDLADILTTGQGRGLLTDLAYQEVNGNDLTTTIGASATPQGASAVIGPGGNLADAVNGTGTHAGVNYQPGVDFRLGDSTPSYQNDPYADFSSDVVLFHELVHANHARQGTLDGRIDPATGDFIRDPIANADATTPRDHGVPREEYATVGLGGHGGPYTENGYRQERELVQGADIPERDNYNGSGP